VTDLDIARPGHHTVRVYDAGPMTGTPVLLLHGGPGGGAQLSHREFVDLSRIRLVQFDQRATGKSSAADDLRDNTTADLVGDIEEIRRRLDIESWWVTGGSWGALLALAYAQAHPRHLRGLALRNVFLDRQADVEWFLDGARRWAPMSYGRLSAAVGGSASVVDEAARRLRSWPDADAVEVVRAWRQYERVLSGLADDGDEPPMPSDVDFRDTRLELHYLRHGFFLEEDQVSSRAPLLSGIPGVVLSGELDRVVAPGTADHVVRQWDSGRAVVVPGAGHSLACPRMAEAWTRTMTWVADTDARAVVAS
jgi:proline iminopeptidase